MTVYKYFMKMVYRYKVYIIMYAIVFFTMSLVNTSAINKQTDFSNSKLEIAVINNSSSELVDHIISYLEKDNYISFMEDDENKINEALYIGNLDGIIKFDADFEEKFQSSSESVTIYGDSNNYGSMELNNQINKYLRFLKGSYSDGNYDFQRIETIMDENVQIEIIGKDAETEDMVRWISIYYNFVAYVLVAIYISILGFIISDFNKKEIVVRTNISSRQLSKYNLEIYLGQMTTALFITSIFIVGSFFIIGKDILTLSFSKYIVNILVFSFSILCFTFLVNNLTRDKNIINMLSIVFSLGMAMLSGVMVPQEILPEIALNIAKAFPVYYCVKANNSLGGLENIGNELIIQVLFGLFFIIVGIFISREKRKAA